MAKSSGHQKRHVVSQAQWRWMYATHQEFAHRWGEAAVAKRGPKASYRGLPTRRSLKKR